ncbi:MAG: hypothetical protein ACK4ZD_13945 [Caldimonas sp.]|uniref:hypothetical protein n=1 Tax=Caldimonas sp. TaxID=2838790 RepID=UPI00391B3482
MLSIRKSGSIAQILREARDVPARVIPYAAATALTRTAKRAQQAIIAEMPQVFDRPTPYTLNSTFVQPASVKTMTARVAVKDWASNNGTLPEDYLLPAVLGGGRKEKRFERNLRYAGLLARGERAVLGQEAPLDAFGNLRRGEMQRILKTDENALYFVGRVKRTRGVWRREGRRLRPVLVFVRRAPQYRARLDFDGIAERTTREFFEAEFRAAAEAIVRRRG